MIVTMLNSANKIVNSTVTEIIDSQIHLKSAEIVGAFIRSGAEAVEDILERIQDFTKEDESE